jgi:hypothetical protein
LTGCSPIRYKVIPLAWKALERYAADASQGALGSDIPRRSLLRSCRTCICCLDRSLHDWSHIKESDQCERIVLDKGQVTTEIVRLQGAYLLYHTESAPDPRIHGTKRDRLQQSLTYFRKEQSETIRNPCYRDSLGANTYLGKRCCPRTVRQDL